MAVNTAILIQPECKHRRLQLFLEANTNDLYLLTYWDNAGKMGFDEIWFLGIGARVLFQRSFSIAAFTLAEQGLVRE